MQEGLIRQLFSRWIAYLSGLLVLTLPFSVVIVRFFDWKMGLTLYAVACFGALMVALIALFSLPMPFMGGVKKPLVIALLLALPGSFLGSKIIAQRDDYPMIHDISTDLQDPPEFYKVATVRSESDNTLDIPESTIDAQRRHYPDITTAVYHGSMEDAFRRCLAVAEDMGWNIINKDPQQGSIEATATTAIMGFKDDVVIRLRDAGDGILVDLRSASRVGVGDLGANARRIQTFLSKL